MIRSSKLNQLHANKRRGKGKTIPPLQIKKPVKLQKMTIELTKDDNNHVVIMNQTESDLFLSMCKQEVQNDRFVLYQQML